MNEQIWLPDLLLADGRLESGLALVVDASGQILRLSRDPSDHARATRLSGQALLPGFVNAHSHSFQRALRGRTEHRTAAHRDTFWTWREKMYHAASALTPAGLHATARMCFLEMALAGITTVGEFHYLHHQPDGTPYPEPHRLAHLVVRAAREVGLRIVLLATGYARAGWRRPLHPGQNRFRYRDVATFLAGVTDLRSELARDHLPADVSLGVAPHSLRAVTLEDFSAINRHGRDHGLPVHVHLSEQRAENSDCRAESGSTPIALLARSGQLHPGLTAIHAVHVRPEEVRALAAADVSVCACPTTERNLGDGLAPTDEFIAAGLNLALGSDSQIQIDPLEDARELDYHVRLAREERAVLVPSRPGDPDGLARRLWHAATAGGARALGTSAGTLAPGRPADFFTVDLRDPSIAGSAGSLAALVFALERTAIRHVVVGGRPIVRDGRHPHAAAITAAFEQSQRELWTPS
jgi:formimidoylglutamate deiminase